MPVSASRRYAHRLIFAAWVTGLVACGGRCGRTPPQPPTAPGRSLLAKLPAATQIALSLDFARLRAGAIWPALRTALGDAGRPEDRALVEAFAARTGFDPFTHVDRVTVAFPENARDRDTFAVLLKARSLDASRLIAYIRERLAERGDDLVSGKHGPFLVWSSKQPPVLEGAFLSKEDAVIGAGTFPGEIMDRWAAPRAAPAAPAALVAPLTELIEALGLEHEIWAAAVVPATTRARLATEPRFHAAASVARLGLAADLDPGLTATVLADLGSEEDARALAREAQEATQRAKADPKVLLLGLSSFLEHLTIGSSGHRFTLNLRLDPAATRELLGRVATWTAFATPRPSPPPGFP